MVNCMTKPGKATIARLNRTEGKYRNDDHPHWICHPAWRENGRDNQGVAACICPTTFDYHIFLDKFDANHCHAVYGDKVAELKMICEMLDIDIEQLA